MKKLDLIKKKKAEVRKQRREKGVIATGEGKEGKRTPKTYGYRQLSVPEDVLTELKTVKEAYETAWGGRMSYGDVISRLMAAAKRYDPEVFADSEKEG